MAKKTPQTQLIHLSVRTFILISNKSQWVQTVDLYNYRSEKQLAKNKNYVRKAHATRTCIAS